MKDSTFNVVAGLLLGIGYVVSMVIWLGTVYVVLHFVLKLW